MKRNYFLLLLLCCNLLAYSQQQPKSEDLKLAETDLLKAQQKSNQAEIADALGRLSFQQAIENDFFKAIENAQKAINMFQILKKPTNEGRCYGTMIWVHLAMHNYEKVEDYAQKVLKIGENERDTALISNALDALANVYDTRKEYDKALKTYNQILQYANTTKQNIGATHSNLASVYGNMKDYNKSLYHAQLGAKHLLEEGDTLRYTTAKYNEAISLAHLKRFTEAEKPMKEANDLSDYMAIPEVMRDKYKENALFFELKGDASKALAAQKKFYSLDSLMTSEEHHQQFAQLEVAYETKQKEKENIELGYKIKMQYVIFGIAALILGMVTILFFLQRNRLKIKNQLLEKEQNFAKYELENYTNMLQEKNDALELMKTQIEGYVSSEEKEKIIAQLLNATILTEEQWKDFKEKFERVHQGFFQELLASIPDITEAEKRFAALTKLNLTGSQIASMLGISPESVIKTRYRLKKKAGYSKTDISAEY